MNITHATHRGARYYQEDRYEIIQAPEGLLIGVFDGHGGDGTSTFCKKELLNYFKFVAENPLMPTIPDKIRGIFMNMNHQTERNDDGSTATIVFISLDNSRAYVGVLGDSPVIIKNEVGEYWHAPEHNVSSNGDEVKRVTAAGARIAQGYMFDPNAGLRGGQIQLTRSFGDREFSPFMGREPEVFEVPLGEGSFVLVGTDGLFDPSHKSSRAAEDVVGLVEKGATALDLVKFAAEVKPTGDNVTAVLVRI